MEESKTGDSPEHTTGSSLDGSPPLPHSKGSTESRDSIATKDHIYNVLFGKGKDNLLSKNMWSRNTDDPTNDASKQFQSKTIKLPPGPLGVDIQRSTKTGECLVEAKTHKSTPLRVGDVIESLNGTALVDVEGGMWAWVNLITTSAHDTRTVVVRRESSSDDDFSISSGDDTVVAGSAPPTPSDVPIIEIVDKAVHELEETVDDTVLAQRNLREWRSKGGRKKKKEAEDEADGEEEDGAVDSAEEEEGEDEDSYYPPDTEDEIVMNEQALEMLPVHVVDALKKKFDTDDGARALSLALKEENERDRDGGTGTLATLMEAPCLREAVYDEGKEEEEEEVVKAAEEDEEPKEAEPVLDDSTPMTLVSSNVPIIEIVDKTVDESEETAVAQDASFLDFLDFLNSSSPPA